MNGKTEATYMKTRELANRWRVSTSTLTKMRSRGVGVPYITMPGGGVLYDLADIVKYEKSNKRSTKSA